MKNIQLALYLKVILNAPILPQDQEQESPECATINDTVYLILICNYYLLVYRHKKVFA